MYKRPMQRRRIAVEGAFNLRDLGGLSSADGQSVRRGHVFRSDALHRLVAADVVTLKAMGIGHVVDLRSDAEVQRDGAGGLPGACRIHAPLVAATLSPFDPTIDWARLDLRQRYIEMLTVGGPAITAVLEAASGPAPVLFHCTAGKDRTGVVAAVLLRVLNVPDESIVADYAISETYLRDHLAGMRAELLRKRFSPDVIEYLTSSPRSRMHELLREMDRRWGSTSAYLEWIGVTEDLCERLRARLLR